ncbi:MAG: hypothetical protein KJ069_24995 [Anaerolineae bacterium]|nr:hypothetical protein [Anaerolineae bacterium]
MRLQVVGNLLGDVAGGTAVHLGCHSLPVPPPELRPEMAGWVQSLLTSNNR